jgi:hypothetical protein
MIAYCGPYDTHVRTRTHILPEPFEIHTIRLKRYYGAGLPHQVRQELAIHSDIRADIDRIHTGLENALNKCALIPIINGFPSAIESMVKRVRVPEKLVCHAEEQHSQLTLMLRRA